MADASSPPPAHDGGAVRVVLRPLASGLPLGFLSFAIGMLLLGGLEVGWVETSEQATVGVLIAAFVFPLELVAAVMAFAARDTLATTVLGLFATSWLAQGLLDVRAEPGTTSDATGLFLLGFAVAIGGSAVLAAAAKPLFAVVLGLSTTRTVLAALYELTDGSGVQHAAGIVSLALAATAAYTGLALMVEDVRKHDTLPVLRRGPAAAATSATRLPNAGELAAEPGVRDQL
jgi:succinate-acetate transporter protein